MIESLLSHLGIDPHFLVIDCGRAGIKILDQIKTDHSGKIGLIASRCEIDPHFTQKKDVDNNLMAR